VSILPNPDQVTIDLAEEGSTRVTVAMTVEDILVNDGEAVAGG